MNDSLVLRYLDSNRRRLDPIVIGHGKSSHVRFPCDQTLPLAIRNIVEN